MDRLTPGTKAPAFALSDQSGTVVKLGDFKGRQVLVYFYPKADTPGCTAQACGLRDVLGQIGDTAVVGISPDKPAKQAKPARRNSVKRRVICASWGPTPSGW